LQAGETSDAEAVVSELAQRVPQHEDALMAINRRAGLKGCSLVNNVELRKASEEPS